MSSLKPTFLETVPIYFCRVVRHGKFSNFSDLMYSYALVDKCRMTMQCRVVVSDHVGLFFL